MVLLPLSRPHEQVIFLVYAALGSFGVATCQYQVLPQQYLEVTITFLWLGFVLAISFLEAWVKFQAPFLRNHVAVDVGRHVLAALHAVELALVSVFWLGRWVLPRAADHSPSASAGPWSVATGCGGIMIFLLAPRLFRRAKFQMVDALREDRYPWTDKEEAKLQKIANEIGDQPRPSAIWHVAYMLLEVVKVGALITFLIGLM
jgi:hypothetical protein